MQISLEQAWEKYFDGNLRLAEALCLALLQQNANSGDTWQLIGLICYDRARFLDAIDALEHASLLIPIRIEASIALANAYAEIGKRELAIHCFLQLAQSPSITTQQLIEVAGGLHHAGDSSAAYKVCKLAIQMNRSEPQAYYDAGYYLSLLTKDYAAVEYYLLIALRLAPHETQYIVGLASLYYRCQRLREASIVAQKLTLLQISQIHCICCLERMLFLANVAGDLRRARTIRLRISDLQQTMVTQNIARITARQEEKG